MAIQFTTNDASTVKLWSGRIYKDFITDSGLLANMIASGVVSKQDKTQNEAGDRVRIAYRNRLTNPGLIGDQVATGNETTVSYFTDDVLINRIRNPITIANTMTISQQRVLYNLPEDAYQSAMDWMKLRGVVGVLNQLAGFNANSFVFDGVTYSGAQALSLTGLNTPIAPSANRIFYPNGKTTEKEISDDPTATLNFTHIDECEAMAETIHPYIRPIDENSGVKYHMYVHTRVWQQLIQNTSAPIQFRDIFNDLIRSGRGDGSIARSMIYSQTQIFKTDKMPNGIDNGTGGTGNILPKVRRSVFCGKDAACLALGRGYTDSKETVPGFIIREDEVDIGDQRRIAISGIFGIKKIQFNNIDNGVIVVPSNDPTQKS